MTFGRLALFSLSFAALAHPCHAARDHVPVFDVHKSCKAAETYNVMQDRSKTFDGCVQDEDRARGLINKNWGQFKAKERQDCITQSVAVAPSYVEILTCLEMSDDTGALLSRDVNQPAGRDVDSNAPTPAVAPAMK